MTLLRSAFLQCTPPPIFNKSVSVSAMVSKFNSALVLFS